MTERKPVECWLTDMDGVLVHEERAIAAASDFIGRLVALERRFLAVTNNSLYTPRDLRPPRTCCRDVAAARRPARCGPASG